LDNRGTNGDDGRVRQRRGTFSGVRGVPIAHREWLPEGDARGSVVIAHGINEHGGRYAHVAERLTRSGWVVAALDHRGHGLSGGRRAAVERFDDWITDLDGYIAGVLVATPRPLFLLGHSLGGLIATVYALRHQDSLDGLVLSSPSVMPPRSMSPAALRVGRLLSRWAANLPLVGLRLDAVSRDPAVVSAYRDDPLVHLGRMRARTGAEALRAIGEVHRDIARLRLPMLTMQGTVDLLVDPGSARWVDEHTGSADHTLRIYEGLYHEVFNEPERDRVLDDLAAWLDAHATAPVAARQGGPGPTGAASPPP
jgi:alpha-beta hydrolase superfamily lysophospholipase